MVKCIDISGIWEVDLQEKDKERIETHERLVLPDSIANAKKGHINDERNTGFLTPEYVFEGTAWFKKKIQLQEDDLQYEIQLFLERTRISTVFINGQQAGSMNSFYAPHCYDITSLCRNGENEIVIAVKNTDYLTKGGHMTSPDTQTNWNGILGRMELQLFNKMHLSWVKISTDCKSKEVILTGKMSGDDFTCQNMQVRIKQKKNPYNTSTQNPDIDSNTMISTVVEETISSKQGELNAVIKVPDAVLWSEFEPVVYEAEISNGDEIYRSVFGFREFTAGGDKFQINGCRTFLRGKHDGMIFPMTGYAPMSVDEWIRVMKISQEYGINHYRFHTCCPPEAAFYAADYLGIYMEPELPFWGSVTEPGEENHNQKEQDFLFEEGLRMLRAYGNHPSFVMMSLGNELWGSHSIINNMLLKYKEFDNRHLYVQGSNNFQFCPVVLEGDDFFCGVRFAKERLIRGSYAMCDAPLGHVQTDRPSAMKNYDEAIRMKNSTEDQKDSTFDSERKGTIQIQYETGAKEVKATGFDPDMIPDVPVVSHEIGQYETFPDFHEIEKYTGLLKARNFEVFLENCKKNGLDKKADDFFINSGMLAMACYKEELEAVARTKSMAGFQLLDLQDFSGQGTALVGVLNAFMENKGIIDAKEWRRFCNNKIILAQFESYTMSGGDTFEAELAASVFLGRQKIKGNVQWKAAVDSTVIAGGTLSADIDEPGYQALGRIKFQAPFSENVKKIILTLTFTEDTLPDRVSMENEYVLWCYPANTFVFQNMYEQNGRTLYCTKNMEEAKKLCNEGRRVLLCGDDGQNIMEGTYCVDFWCYPMFKTISEMFKKPLPIGTMGLNIEKNHPALHDFLCESYTTPQWYDIINETNCAILDDLPKDSYPIVQMIDNFERCHKLGILYELPTGKGRILVCTANLEKHQERREVRQFMKSIVQYGLSDEFM